MRTCTVDGCGNAHLARGFCVKHYSRFMRHGTPVITYAERDTELIGRRFSRLVVVSREWNEKAGRFGWICLCDCGKTTQVRSGQSLLSGNTRSCGCLRLDNHAVIHGQAHLPEYKIWQGMKRRCYNEKVAEFKYYGGRGIRVCDRWVDSFESFYEDMGPRPHGMTLDRYPDVNGSYEPGNCRWATLEQQSRNKRNTRILSIWGISACMQDWSDCSGVRYKTVRSRLDRGKTQEQALEIEGLTIAWG